MELPRPGKTQQGRVASTRSQHGSQPISPPASSQHRGPSCPTKLDSQHAEEAETENSPKKKNKEKKNRRKEKKKKQEERSQSLPTASSEVGAAPTRAPKQQRIEVSLPANLPVCPQLGCSATCS